MDRLDRRAEGVAASSLHFDEGDQIAESHDEVEITMTTAESMCHDGPAVTLHPPRRYALALQSELLSLFRHGSHDRSTGENSTTEIARRWSE